MNGHKETRAASSTALSITRSARKPIGAVTSKSFLSRLTSYLGLSASLLFFSPFAKAVDFSIGPPLPDGRYQVGVTINGYAEVIRAYQGKQVDRTIKFQVRWQDWPGGGMRSREIGPGDDYCDMGKRTCSFTFIFTGPPGSSGTVAVQDCYQDDGSAYVRPGGMAVDWIGNKLLATTHCSGFKNHTFVIPEGKPAETVPPSLVRIEPATYMPRRYRRVSETSDPTDRQMPVTPSGKQVRVLLHMKGSLDEIPAPPFAPTWGYRPPHIKVSWRANTVELGATRLERVRKEGSWVEVTDLKRQGDVYAFYLPESALENSYCEGSRCDPVVISVDFVTRGRISNEIVQNVRSEERKIQLVTRYSPTQDPLVLAARNEPAAIISRCNVTHNIGTMQFVARHSKAFGTDHQVLVDLQFAAGQGLWGSSNLLTQLRQVANSKPPEFRATLPVNQMARLSPSWRWRVKAAEGDRTGDWCYFQVAGVADTAMKPKPATLPAKSPGAQLVLSAPGAVSGTNPSATASAPIVLSAPKGASGGDAGGSRQMNAPVNIGAPSAARPATVAPTSPSQVASLGKLQVGVNRVGDDYRSQPAVTTAQACQALCMGEGQCKAWTWVAAEKRCWLKSSVPVASKGDCCTSGVK